MKKLTTIVYTGRRLTKEERKNFKKDNPGYRLSFWLRYPNFGLYFSIFSLLVSIMALLIRIVM